MGKILDSGDEISQQIEHIISQNQKRRLLPWKHFPKIEIHSLKKRIHSIVLA